MGKGIVLITGATSGIGFETALLLAKAGYQVIATGRTEEKLVPLRKAAEDVQLDLSYETVDVASAASIAELKSRVLQETNGYGVDVLINNAGYAEGGAIEEISLERLRKQFDTNVVGLVAMTQAFLPMMRTRKKGKIVNLSSVVGKITIPLMGAYCASKYAVESLSDALRVELKSADIDVIVIAPGSIQTQFGKTLSGSIDDQEIHDSPYHQAYLKMKTDRESDRGAHPVVIAKEILNAIGSPKPKTRYALPIESKAMPVIKAILPTRTLDWLVRRVMMGSQSDKMEL